VLAIVPVKGLDAGAKRRLSSLLSSRERAELVTAMLDDVLAACAETASVDKTLVVTPDARVARGDDVLIDEGRGHPEAIAAALRHPQAADGALVVMADCPLVTAEALDQLAAGAEPISIGPARDGGLNAVALASSGAIEPVFGVENAAAITIERARAAGVEPAVVAIPELAFDVDDPPDVWKLREHDHGTRAGQVLTNILPATGGLV
jgi:2-phospho-L-lactate/phosphoenolpyruvate guanylyltransferase